MKKIKLEVGQIWQVPDKKWIRVRVITDTNIDVELSEVCYLELGEGFYNWVQTKSFRLWIRRNEAKLIGIKDFKTWKARVVK